MPEKPLMIFDGDCGFCTRWIKRWRRWTGDCVQYAPSQDENVRSRFPEVPNEAFEESVQLIETDGKVYSGAEAAFRSLAYNRNKRWLFWIYKKVPGAAPITEWFYRFVANHRNLFSKLTRLVLGKED